MQKHGFCNCSVDPQGEEISKMFAPLFAEVNNLLRSWNPGLGWGGGSDSQNREELCLADVVVCGNLVCVSVPILL
jgi:hypothetical protein